MRFLISALALSAAASLRVPPASRLHRVRRGAAAVVEPVAATMVEPVTIESRERDYSTFDWNSHWYPVAWACDLSVDRPSKVTLFDTDYCVVVRGGDLSPLALDDRCPHRLASLSEGRLTSQGYVQCAYHGWAFDGISGACQVVPQQTGGGGSARARARGAVEGGAMCATAVPCRVEQGLVWIFPGGESGGGGDLPEIPRVPEMDRAEYGVVKIVRDLPIDYSLLVENILDPDHGVFAHQAPAFDMYTASRDSPQSVAVRQPSLGCFELESTVAAFPKLTSSAPPPASPPVGTSTFRAPCSIVTARRDAAGESKFLTCFWVSPQGVGRSRFFAASVGKALPFSPPRWATHVALNNFLDQDTHLLATQQPRVLAAELAAHQRGTAPLVRRRLYRYASPTERFLVEVGKFLDAAMPTAPNRYAEPATFAAQCPPRERTLDRWAQHTLVCPDSLDAVRNSQTLRAAAAAAAAALAGRNVARWLVVGGSGGGGGKASRALALARCCSPLVLAAAAVALLAHRVIGEFSFKYVARKRDKDLKGIPKLFADNRYDLDSSSAN